MHIALKIEHRLTLHGDRRVKFCFLLAAVEYGERVAPLEALALTQGQLDGAQGRLGRNSSLVHRTHDTAYRDNVAWTFSRRGALGGIQRKASEN